jgi:hypothetical protein
MMCSLVLGERMKTPVSPFHCFNKMPEITKRGKVYFGKVSKISVHGLCFGACGESVHHGGEHRWNELLTCDGEAKKEE